MLTAAGAKVLDFGLAKPLRHDRPAVGTASPTNTAPVTVKGSNPRHARIHGTRAARRSAGRRTERPVRAGRDLPLSVAANGTLAYWDGQPARTELVWRDRTGRVTARLGLEGQGLGLALAPDGRSLALTRRVGKLDDVWRVDLDSGRASRLVEAPGNQLQGRLSPGSEWLAYASDESGGWEVYVQPFPPGSGRWQVSTAGGSIAALAGRR